LLLWWLFSCYIIVNSPSSELVSKLKSLNSAICLHFFGSIIRSKFHWKLWMKRHVDFFVWWIFIRESLDSFITSFSRANQTEFNKNHDLPKWRLFASLRKSNMADHVANMRHPGSKQNISWRTYASAGANELTDRDKMSNLYRGPYIDASYHVSAYLAQWFQRRRFLEIVQSETRIACDGHVCYRIGTKWAIFIEDLPYIFPTKFRFIWPCSFRGEDF
jgi:hypothetical protein